jgi:hypothetical protein
MKELQERDELANDLAHKVAQMMDRFNQRLRMHNLRLVERYVKAELHFLVHFLVRGANEQFVAHLQRAQGIGWPHENRYFGKLDAGERGLDVEMTHHVGAKINASKSGADSDQVAVLAEIVQLVKNPEFVPFPTFVRFDSEQGIYDRLRHSLYFSLAFGFVFRGVRSVLGNGEVNMASVAAGSSFDKQSISQMIQDRDHISDGIGGNLRNEVGRHVYDMRYIIDQFSRVRIILGSDLIWAGIQKGVDCGIQIQDVLFGPFDF